MTPIPGHLARYRWYPGHCAWVLATYGACRHVPPVGTAPVRADLRGADLTGANLADADLSRANLSRAILRGTILRGADLRGAVLTGADFSGANLSRAYLAGADFRGANLSRAYLAGADFSGADLSSANLRDAVLTGAVLRDAGFRDAILSGARGILAIGPVGAEGRTIYAVRHTGGPMVQAGCFWGRPAKIRTRISARYADGTGREQYRAGYLAAIDRIEAWAAGVDP